MKGLPDIRRQAITQSPGFVAEDGAARGQATLFSGLSQAAKRLRQELQPVLDRQAEEQAAEDVIEASRAREDGRTVVNVPVRLALTRQDQVYNQVVEAGVLATSRSDFAEEVGRLSQAHQFDPKGYQKSADAFIEQYTKSLQTRELGGRMMIDLELAARNAFAAEGARIEDNTRQVQARETQDGLQRRLDQVNAEVATLLERDGMSAVSGEEYQELEQEAVDIVDILVENPIYGWSGDRGAEALDGLFNQGAEIIAIQGMEAVYHNDGVIKSLEFIDRAVNGMTLDQQERIGARSRMQQRLNILQQMTALEEAEAKQKNDAQIEQLETVGIEFEAGLLQRMGAGEKPSQRDLAYAALLVQAGSLKPSRMNVYVNAATSTSPTLQDEAVLASLNDYARLRGVTLEDVEEYTMAAVGAGSITAAQRESVLAEYDQSNDERFEAGEDLLDGFFATGFMDFDTGAVKSAKARSVSELSAWFRNNPDVTTSQMEQKARQLAVESGRRMPKPPVPHIPGLTASSIITVDTVGVWANNARMAAADAYSNDPAEFNRVMSQIAEMEGWTRDQQRFQQENVNAQAD